MSDTTHSNQSRHVDLFPVSEDTTPYRKLSGDYVRTFEAGGRSFLEVD